MADLRVGGSLRHLHLGRLLRHGIQLIRHAAGIGTRWLSRQEAVVLVAVLVVLLALFGFIKIVEELGEGELAGLDKWLLLHLRVPGQPHVPIGPAWLVEAAQDITVLGGRTMLAGVTLFAIGYLRWNGNMARCGSWQWRWEVVDCSAR